MNTDKQRFTEKRINRYLEDLEDKKISKNHLYLSLSILLIPVNSLFNYRLLTLVLLRTQSRQRLFEKHVETGDCADNHYEQRCD